MRHAAALALALLATPLGATRAAAPPALAGVTEALARDVGAPPEGRRALLLEIESRAPDLRAPLEAALEAALAARGWAVTPHRGGGDAEARARSAGHDWLLRVRAGLVPGRRELSAVGELIPAWASFFLQHRPDARAVPPRLVQGTAAADPETLLLSRETRPPGALFAVVRPLARVPGRVLALAVGTPADDGRPAIVAVTDEALVVLGPAGERIADGRSSAAGGGRPARPRDAAAVLAVGDFGGGRIAVARAGAARGEVLALRRGRLEPAGSLDAAPLCGGGDARLFGAFEPGTSVLSDVLTTLVDPAAPPRSQRTLYGAACAPHGGPIAFAALGTDLALEILGPELAPVPASVPLSTGSGFALADLDGDGVAELVASSADPAAPERIRILAPRAEAPLLLESPPVEGAILAGAGGDLTGDGLDDAVLGAVRARLPSSRGAGGGREGGVEAGGVEGGTWTDLWLVTADPREAR